MDFFFCLGLDITAVGDVLKVELCSAPTDVIKVDRKTRLISELHYLFFNTNILNFKECS